MIPVGIYNEVFCKSFYDCMSLFQKDCGLHLPNPQRTHFSCLLLKTGSHFLSIHCMFQCIQYSKKLQINEQPVREPIPQPISRMLERSEIPMLRRRLIK